MKTWMKELLYDTHDDKELIDISKDVKGATRESGVAKGICLGWSTHTTASVLITENEPGLLHDLISKIGEDFPRRGTWLHNLIDDNAHAHLAGTYVGQSISIPVADGVPQLGEFQSVFLAELDGPRKGRKILIEVMGE